MLDITLAKNWRLLFVTLERPNTTLAEFANNVDPHNHSRWLIIIAVSSGSTVFAFMFLNFKLDKI